MDRLSITASVVNTTTAALQSAQFLINTINSIKDAPGTVKDISADLRAIESVLQDLNEKVKGDSSQAIRSNQIQPAVENCDRACKAFQFQVERWMKHSKEDELFWVYRWKIELFGQEKIETFKGQLGDCKSTLNVALSTATLLAVVGQKELPKGQKDTILKASEADLQQELTQASREMVEIEHSLQQLTVARNPELDEESEQSRQELVHELQMQQSTSTALRDVCEEALLRTGYERTGQTIKGVKATNDGVVLAGYVNTSGEHLNINQEISDVSADNRGFVAAGVIKNLDFKDLRVR